MAERTGERKSPKRPQDEALKTLPIVVSRTFAITILSMALCYGSYLIFDLPYWTEPLAMILPVLAPVITAPWFIHI
jgi:hypothetical protein